MIRYVVGQDVPLQPLLDLYRALGWLQHQYPERVQRAIQNSARVATAWDGDRLIGMARIVSDGEFALFLPEVLLLPEYQRQGHGRELMNRVLEGYEHVQNQVLLSDRGNEPFYARWGFEPFNPEWGTPVYRFGGWPAVGDFKGFPPSWKKDAQGGGP